MIVSNGKASVEIISWVLNFQLWFFFPGIAICGYTLEMADNDSEHNCKQSVMRTNNQYPIVYSIAKLQHP